MILRYENVDICLSGRTVIADCSMEVDEGEMIYIIGPVGSGKSTFLRTIYGEIKPAKGTAEVLEMDLMKMKESRISALRRHIGMDFQDFKFLSDRTVGENLDFVLCATGWKEKDDRRCRIIEVLEQVGLPDKINQYAYELSGGEKQRISIARAILNEPHLILADEPTSNLDYESGKQIIELLCSLKDKGATVIMTTHNQAWPMEYPGKVYHCHEGKILPVDR